MAVEFTFGLFPGVIALVGWLAAKLLRTPPRAGMTLGLVGTAAGLALECWLFFGLIPDSRVHECRYDSLTSTTFWTSLYLTAFASGVPVVAAKAPVWVSILLAVIAGV